MVGQRRELSQKTLAASIVTGIFLSLIPSPGVFAAQISADSLIGYWKLDETSGTSATDWSGDDVTGDYNGSPVSSTNVPSVAFYNARSRTFDGVDDFVSAFGVRSNGSAPFTYSFWMKTADSSGTHRTMLSEGRSSTDTPTFHVQFTSDADTDCTVDETLKVYMADDAGTITTLCSTSTYNDGTWHHIALIQTSSSNRSLYVDGVLVDTDTASLGTTTFNRVGIGALHRTTTGQYFPGSLDDVRIYNRAIARWELAELASGRHIPAYWKGRSGNAFERKQNWSGSYIPDPYSRMVIRAATGALTLTGAVQASSLTINSGSVFLLNNQEMMINDGGAFTNYGTLGVKNSTDALFNVNIPTNKGAVMLMGTGSYTGLVMGDSYHDLILNDGLVTYLTLDETSEDRAADSSGWGNSGSLVSGAAASLTVAPTRFRNVGSVFFDGSDDYLYAGQGQLPTGAASRTIAGWIQMTSNTSGTKVPFAYGNCSVQGDAFGVYLNGSEQLSFWGCGTGDFDASATLAMNTWYHIAVTYNGTNVRVFVNGAQVGPTTARTLTTGTKGLFVGNDGTLDPANYAFPGLVDDLRIYNRALTVGEVSALAAGNQPSLQLGSVTLSQLASIEGDLVLNGGTLNAGAENIHVYGSWLNNGGVFNPGRGTVSLLGTSDYDILSGGQRFNDLYLGANSTWTLADRLTVSGALTLSNGMLDAGETGNYSVRAGRVVWGSGDFEPRSGILVLTSGADQTITPPSALSTLHIEDSTERGLAGYWKFDEGTNTGSIMDSSPYRHTGVRHGTGGTIWSGSTLPSAIGFENPFAMKFETMNDYVEVADSAALTNNSFSACTWMKWDGVRYTTGSLRDWAGLVSKGRYNSGEFTILMSRNSAASTNTFGFYINGGSRATFTTSATLGTTWHHICAVYDQVRARLYLDGTERAALTYTAAVSDTSNALHIGDENGGVNGYRFGGYLDDVRYYNRALSVAEVRRLADGLYADGDSGTATVTLGGDLDLSTMTIVSGVVSAGARTIDVSGDWNNYAGTGGFVMGTSTVDLDGSSTQTVRGSTNFADFEISTSAAQTVRFASGSVLGVTSGLILQGAALYPLTLSPLTAGYEWFINLADDAAQSVSFVNPSYSDASLGHFIDADDGTSTDAGNNSNWLFVTPEIAFQSGSLTVSEAAGTITLTLARSGSVVPTLAIPFTLGGTATAAGTDYSVVSDSPLSMVAGLTSTGLVLTLVDDAAVEADETIILTIGSPTNAVVGATGSLTITVTSNDAASSAPSSSSAGGTSGGGGAGGTRGAGTGLDAALRARAALLERYRRVVTLDDKEDVPRTVPSKPEKQPSEELPNAIGGESITKKRNRIVLVTGDVLLVYKDVVADSWYAPFVASVIENGIARGYQDGAGRLTGEFGIANPVTRAEILKMALEAAGKAGTKAAPARNTSAQGTWASSYVGIAETLNLSVFPVDADVNKSATRGEVVQTIMEVMGATIGKTPATYADVPVNHPYTNAIGAATFFGVVEGDMDASGAPLNRFRPDEPINRAEVSKIIALMREVLQ